MGRDTTDKRSEIKVSGYKAVEDFEGKDKQIEKVPRKGAFVAGSPAMCYFPSPFFCA